jgi:hypothetical protein
VLNSGLLDIQRMLEEHGFTLRSFPCMPIPVQQAVQVNRLLQAQLAYNTAALAAEVAAKLPLLTPEQRAIFDAVNRALDDPQEVCDAGCKANHYVFAGYSHG